MRHPRPMTSSASLPAYAELVRRQDPDRFFTALFAPPERRDALLMLYAFNVELARARAVVSEPTLALIRLQWWREVVDGQRKRHEIATPLSDAIEAGVFGRSELARLIDAREQEAEPSISDHATFLHYLDGTAGALAIAAARLLGASDPNGVLLQGRAYGLAGQLRSIAGLAARGRCHLPEDTLRGFGLTTFDVVADPASAKVDAVKHKLAEEGLSWIGHARSFAPRSAIAAALTAVLARRDLRRVSGTAPGPRGFADKLAVMLAAARGRI